MYVCAWQASRRMISQPTHTAMEGTPRSLHPAWPGEARAQDRAGQCLPWRSLTGQVRGEGDGSPGSPRRRGAAQRGTRPLWFNSPPRCERRREVGRAARGGQWEVGDGRSSLEPGQSAGPSWVRQTGHQSGSDHEHKEILSWAPQSQQPLQGQLISVTRRPPSRSRKWEA